MTDGCARAAAGSAPPLERTPLLEVRELRTWFSTEEGEARAVDGVSLAVEEGEALGVVGESGCGKTVTALSLTGLVPSPPGRMLPGSSIRLRGRELVGLRSSELRKLRGSEIAMVFQEPMTSLNPVYTVGEQVAESVRRHRKLRRREARQEAVRLLREVGIPDPEARYRSYPHQLSGGMRQRVMVASALSGEPSLLIADEPTTALDVTIQAQLLELLADLRRRRGMALLLISHDLGVVAEVCDRVLVMYGGQVVEQGTVEEIFQEPTHPYTIGLLGSLPRMGGGRGRLTPIEGTVPGPARWPSGCRFHPRCPRAWDRCMREPPPLLPEGGSRGPPDEGSGRAARCWLVEEPEAEGELPGEGT